MFCTFPKGGRVGEVLQTWTVNERLGSILPPGLLPLEGDISTNIYLLPDLFFMDTYPFDFYIFLSPDFPSLVCSFPGKLLFFLRFRFDNAVILVRGVFWISALFHQVPYLAQKKVEPNI